MQKSCLKQNSISWLVQIKLMSIEEKVFLLKGMNNFEKIFQAID